MPAPSELDPLRQSISDALAVATKADVTATQALEISRKNADQLMVFAAVQKRTEDTLNEHRVLSETRHKEVMNAIESAAATDKKQAAAIAAVESKLSNSDIGKIAGGVTALLVAIAGAITLAATQLAPVLPSIAQQHYGQQPQPIIVLQPAPSASVGGAP